MWRFNMAVIGLRVLSHLDWGRGVAHPVGDQLLRVSGNWALSCHSLKFRDFPNIF